MLPIALRLLNALLLDQEGPPSRKISDAFPDVPVTNQFGDSLSFRRHYIAPAGAVVINTMFTTCRGSCSVTSSVIEQLRSDLSPLFGNSLTFISLTLDPAVDTPSVLLRYAQIFGAADSRPEQSRWHFLTMSPADLEPLRRSLGFFDLDPRVDRDVTQHASTLLVGNIRTDRWCALPAQLRRPVLLDSIRRVAGFTFEQRYGISG